jgi:uncharacterized protein
MRRMSPRSLRVLKVEATPRAPARPVRPTRWTKSSGTCGRSSQKIEAVSSLASDGLSWNRMGVDETLLSEVVRRVLTVARPNRIILFGSAATGQMTQDSDIDLLVVEPEPSNARDRSVKIRRALGDVQYPVDVIVMSSERFEETKDFIGGIAYPAHKYGRILYEAA